LEISAVTNIPEITIKPKPDIVPGKIAVAQNAQPSDQGIPEHINDAFSEEQIKKVIDKANQSLAEHSTKLAFSIHDQTKEIMVKVLDADSGEVIKEIPSQKSLDRLAAVLENIG